MNKIYAYESFGAALAFAESLGWVDPDLDDDGEWTAEKADATEQSALDFIIGRGFVLDMTNFTLQQREQLQHDIIAHCDGLPSELIAKLCEVVATFPAIQGESDNE
jgi:hypothetical protein